MAVTSLPPTWTISSLLIPTLLFDRNDLLLTHYILLNVLYVLLQSVFPCYNVSSTGAGMCVLFTDISPAQSRHWGNTEWMNMQERSVMACGPHAVPGWWECLEGFGMRFYGRADLWRGLDSKEEIAATFNMHQTEPSFPALELVSPVHSAAQVKNLGLIFASSHAIHVNPYPTPLILSSYFRMVVLQHNSCPGCRESFSPHIWKSVWLLRL